MKKNLLLNLILGLCVIAAGLAIVVYSQVNRPQTTTKVKMLVGPYVGTTPLYLAKEKGYYSGVDVEFVKSEGSQYVLEVLQSGQADIIYTTFGAKLINGYNKGIKFKIVAGSAPEPRILLVRKDLIDSGAVKEIPQDLRGKTIRIQGEGQGPHYMLTMVLKNNGLSIEDIKLKSARASEMLATFESKSIDASTGGTEPFRTYAIDKGLATEYSFPEQDQYEIIIASDEIIQKNPEAIRKILKGYLRAIAYYQKYKNTPGQQKEELAELISSFSGVPLEVVNKMRWPDFPKDGKPLFESLNNMQDFFYEKGFIDKKSSEEMLNLSYLK